MGTRHSIQGTWKDQQGAVINGETLTVTLTGTSTVAIIYAASSGGSAIANGQITLSSVGIFKFWVDEDDYATTQRFRLAFTGAKFDPVTLDDIAVFDGGITATSTDTLTNKTLTSPVLTTPAIASFTNATHDHADAAGGGSDLAGRLDLLSTATASTSASLEFKSLLAATYDEYFVKLDHVLPTTDADELFLEFSNDNGVSYKTGATDHAWTSILSTATPATIADAGTDSIELTTPTGGGGNVAGEGWSGTIHIINPLDAGNTTRFLINGVYENGDPLTVSIRINGFVDAAEATDAFRLIMSSGTIASGVAKLYGLRV